MRRYRQGERADPARLGGARTLFSQWLGCGTEQRRGVWLLHEFDWHHGEGVL